MLEYKKKHRFDIQTLIKDLFLTELLYSYARSLIMQEYQKLLKKKNKSAVNQIKRENTQTNNDIEGLLKIDLITIPEKIRVKVQKQNKVSRQSNSRKSHRSLAANFQIHGKPPKNPKKKSEQNHQIKSSKVSRVETHKSTEKQEIQQSKQQTQRSKEPSEYTKQSFEHDFVQKKMKVGQKVKTNAIKQFILSTLMKGKAESNCLVIHKGTAQCSYSPTTKNKSEVSKHQKKQSPLILVEENKKLIEKRKKPNQSMFGQKSNKVNRITSTKSTSINLPSINKNLVKMARQFQKKEQKAHINYQNIEVIQEKIQPCQQEQKQTQHPQIQQEIIVNEYVVKLQLKAS